MRQAGPKPGPHPTAKEQRMTPEEYLEKIEATLDDADLDDAGQIELLEALIDVARNRLSELKG